MPAPVVLARVPPAVTFLAPIITFAPMPLNLVTTLMALTKARIFHLPLLRSLLLHPPLRHCLHPPLRHCLHPPLRRQLRRLLLRRRVLRWRLLRRRWLIRNSLVRTSQGRARHTLFDHQHRSVVFRSNPCSCSCSRSESSRPTRETNYCVKQLPRCMAMGPKAWCMWTSRD